MKFTSLLNLVGKAARVFLSASPGCNQLSLRLVLKDDGSGLQRWVRTKLRAANSISPFPALLPPPVPSLMSLPP